MIDSPKLKSKRVNVFDIKNTETKDNTSIGSDMGSVSANYLPENEKRVGNAADNLKPQQIFLGISVNSEAEIKGLENRIKKYHSNVSGFCVITLPDYISECKKI